MPLSLGSVSVPHSNDPMTMGDLSHKVHKGTLSPSGGQAQEVEGNSRVPGSQAGVQRGAQTVAGHAPLAQQVLTPRGEL